VVHVCAVEEEEVLNWTQNTSSNHRREKTAKRGLHTKFEEFFKISYSRRCFTLFGDKDKRTQVMSMSNGQWQKQLISQVSQCLLCWNILIKGIFITHLVHQHFRPQMKPFLTNEDVLSNVSIQLFCCDISECKSKDVDGNLANYS